MFKMDFLEALSRPRQRRFRREGQRFVQGNFRVVVVLIAICASIIAAYDWVSSDFERIQNVSILGGLVITVALSWGNKAGNLRRIAKAMLRDFEFYKFTTVDVGSLIFRFCHWIFWSATIAACFAIS